MGIKMDYKSWTLRMAYHLASPALKRVMEATHPELLEERPFSLNA